MTQLWQRISVKRPRWVIGLSVIFLVFLGWYGFGIFGTLTAASDLAAPGTQSYEATEAIKEEFGAPSSSQIILFERKDAKLGRVDSEAYQAEVTRLLAPLEGEATSILTFGTTGADAFISHDDSSTYAVVALEDDENAYAILRSFTDRADQSKLSISIGGNDALNAEMGDVVSRELLYVELFSVPILLGLLLLFFRSFIASLIPIGIAIFTVIGGFAITRLFSNFVTIDAYAVNVITILGIGLSIDYALLSVNRFREELPKGIDYAVKKIIATSGHTIFFSGITVIACLLALSIFPIEIMRSIAVGGAAAVAVAIATTYIVLPPVLKLLGSNIDKGTVRHKKKADSEVDTSSIWYRVASLTTSRPILSLTLGLAVVGLALIPLLQFQPAGMDHNWLSRSIESGKVMTKLSDNFTSSTPDAHIVAKVDGSLGYGEKLDLSCELTDTFAQQKHINAVQSATSLAPDMSCGALKQLHTAGMVPAELQAMMDEYIGRDIIVFNAFFEDVSSAKKDTAILALRDIKKEGVEILVGGMTAEIYDVNQIYFSKTPIVVGVIAISMIALLAIALRSFVVPVQAIITNSLGIAISIALVVGIFQLGWFSGITGWPQVDGIALTAPVLVIAIAFGLAMDYSVFLFSRMREVYDETNDVKQSIRVSITKTGPIITAAAMAFFVVVAGLAFSSTLMMQMIGIGLAIAVVVDAFFVRLILVPALMTLLGRFGWK